MDELMHRAQGALAGLAIGDALGMPTQLLSRQQVATLFPSLDGLKMVRLRMPSAPGSPREA